MSFIKELEFVQLLCNPEYLRFLYDNKYFHNEEFISYLKYLRYFNDVKYKKFLLYPQCLYILDVLCSDGILEKLGNEAFYSKLSEQQYYIWKNRK